MQTAARFFFLSACLWLAALVTASPNTLRDKVAAVDSEVGYRSLVNELNETLGGDWSPHESMGEHTGDRSWRECRKEALLQLDNVINAEKAASGRLRDPQAESRKILSSPEYHDNGVRNEKNWLSQSLERAGRFISDWFENLLKKLFGNAKGMELPSSGFGRINFQPVVWGVLICGLLAFAVYAVTRFRWVSSRKVKAGGLLDDDEPDRTADEWVVRSEELTANKQYREAVRCLYLASLVRFDEANVMRFRRGETNWEHLRRYQESPRRPEGLDLAEATRAFDVIWYGQRTRGQADVDWFRAFYEQVIKVTHRTKTAA